MYQSVPKVENAAATPTVLKVQVEGVRFQAYLTFWGMCLFAMICTKLFVEDTLGPCPLTEGAEPTYGLHCSALMTTFGFNNICVFWDYSPARELTAMVYPLFEYALIAYIILDHIQTKNDYDNGKVPPRMYSAAKVLLWVKLVLVAWFRMIFVCSVFQPSIPIFGIEISAVVAHTLSFFGMQFALILLAAHNVMQIYYDEKKMMGMSVSASRCMAMFYLVALTVVTGLKISWASSIFITGTPWIDAPWPHIFDRTWMVLAAFMPLVFSWNSMKSEPEMVFTVTQA